MDNQKYAVSIKLIGVMHKETVKMYMTSVLWSDDNEMVVYRSLQDFKDLHWKLKKRFPPQNPLKKSERLVPKFKAKKAKNNVGKKGPSKSVLRLKALEQYCNDLLNSDNRVAHSADFRQFLLPNSKDMSPEFSKNSIVIMPSEDGLDGAGGNGDSSSGGNVTQPFVTETYRCVAPYETKDTKNKPFKVDIDQTVDVLIKDKAGWWLVENEAKCMAWFPAPYLEKVDADIGDDLDNTDGGVLYCCSKTFKAKSSDELSVDMGSVVEVLQKSENGWWLVRHNRKTGYTPSMYLQPYNNPRVQLLTAQKEMRSSTLNLAQLQQRPGSPGGASVASGFLLAPSSQQQLSRSQGNLLKLPGSASSSRSPSPTLTPRLNLKDRYKSRSMNTLESEDSPDAIYQNPRSLGVPSLRVDPGSSPNLAAGDSMGREESVDRGSEEGSEEGDDSEFSFSDDGSTFSGTSSLNVSRSDLREELQRSRTPDPPTRAGLSPDSGLGVPGGRLMPSRSQPNLANLASTPKVPPRPRAKELSRCTTVTRKNAMAIQNQRVPQIGTITSY
ncbi:NADPH oxidase organizer 1a [Engraulis encrasicolus]|uniref:NADPH oxidase organizer 1a n=1 Tax=Engraulis encrasicolus TaxID=184585 RepID=UPI002FD72D75